MALSLVQLLVDAERRHAARPALGMAGADGTLSFRELGERSALLAGQLAAMGVRRGDRVGLLLPKSVPAVVGVWAALRAGAAYVPIDPGAPPARAALVAADCGLRALLASSDLAEAAAAVAQACPGLALLQVHGEGALAGACAPPAPAAAPPPPNSKDLAYVLYTSGSTGVPKGVMVSHGAALSFVEWAAGTFGLTSEDVLSSHAPLHFDLSTFDLFGAALAGARLVVLDEETVRFPIVTAEALERERVSVCYCVPGALRRMLRAGQLAGRDLRALRLVLFAGEPYPADELRLLQDALPRVELCNLYGPTETNVCTYWRVPPAGTWLHPSVPIGVDCENCEGVVVDADLRPVPDGTRGELLVRGGTLMEGYWGDPERSRRGLVPDLLHPHLGDRLYRTGDLVSRGADGVYSYHGRLDHMVKVRGYRVELGEVETALLRAPGVGEAAVVAVERDGQAGPETVLVAFVSAAAGDPPAAADLRRHLAGLLPKYMWPADLRFVDRLPSTSTGKLDRQALAALARLDGAKDPRATG